VPEPGQQMMSLRSQQGWRGITTNTQADLGDRRFSLMENVYISPDGSELRMFPGYKTVYCFNGGRAAIQGGSFPVTGTGFWKDVNDFNFPVSAAVSNNYKQYETGYTRQLKVYAEPLHLHCFKFVRNRLCLIGESAPRKEPILNSGVTTYITITAWSGANPCVLTCSANPLVDAGGFVNAVAIEAVVLLTGAALPTALRDRVHRVKTVAGNQITLWTDNTGGGGSGTAAIDLVRWGTAWAAGTYPQVKYDPSAIDDPQALTAWWSLERPNVDSLVTDCFPSYVANRVRDCGDAGTRMTEGSNLFLGRGNPGVNQGGGGVAGLVFTSTSGVPLFFHDTADYWVGWVAYVTNGTVSAVGTVVDNTTGVGFTVTVDSWRGGAPAGAGWTLTLVNVPFSRRRPRELPFRVNPDLAGSRVLLGAPGYGCTFQVPCVLPNDPNIVSANVGLQYRANDIFDRPRSNGVPKAEMYTDRNLGVGSAHLYATGTAGRPTARYEFTNGQTFKFWVSYRDDATGEVGLLSEPLTITIPAAARGVRLIVKHPGYVLAETMALTVLVWRSLAGGDSPFLVGALPLNTHAYPAAAPPFPELTLSDVSVKYGVEPVSTLNTPVLTYEPRRKHFQLDVPFCTSAELEAADVPTNIEQMPAGAGCVRTVRGYTFYGNRIGNAGSDLELFKSKLTTRYEGLSASINTAYGDVNRVTIRDALLNYGTTEHLDGPWLCGNASFSSAYSGINTMIGGVQVFPFPTVAVGLESVTNVKTDNSSSFAWTVTERSSQAWQNYIVEDTGIIPGTGADSANFAWGGTGLFPTMKGVDAYMELPRGAFQWSLVGNPWATPATQIGYVDAEGAEEVEGIGSLGGGVIFATRSNTYYQTFVNEPRSLPDVATDEFGCIAANSMVEYDGGTAWLSERGPVAMSGGVVGYVGRDLERWFAGRGARFKRDSRGLMRHAWASHDNDRGLVYFGMFADRNKGTANQVRVVYHGVSYTWDDAPDEARSRFPCDEVLVWNYRQGAFTLWVPMPGLEVFAMERTVDAAGANRMLFIAADFNIYALDDLYNDVNKDPITAPVTAVAGTTSAPVLTVGGTLANDIAARNTGENFIRIGMNVIVTRGSSATTVGIGTVTAFTSNTVTLALEEPSQLRVGDQIGIGVRRALIETNFIAPTMTEMGRELRSLHCRYSLASLWTGGGLGVPQPAAIRVKAYPTRRPDTVDNLDTLGDTTLTRIENTGLSYKSLGASITDEWGPITRLTSGIAKSDTVKIGIDLVGGAQVRVADLIVEV
jgi:hypothetical protein